MINQEFVMKFDEDDRLVYYHPLQPIQIFGFELDRSDCEISISKDLNWTKIAPILTKYLEWLSVCKNEVTHYFRSTYGENLPEHWFESIEIYNASITFLDLEDFGATVQFGESVFADHMIEFHFDKFEIFADGLTG